MVKADYWGEPERFEGEALICVLGSIEDPRLDRRKLYPLKELLLVAISAMLCGAESFRDFEEFGEARLVFLRRYLPFANGIASHDTFARVFSLMEPKTFANSLLTWFQSLLPGDEKQIAIDGKTLRRSFDKAKARSAIHVVSAFASNARLVLAQYKVEEKSNEIDAIPEVLSLLDLKGKIVSIDAMGCQRAIAEKIVKKKADYVLALKGNQGILHEQASTLFELELSKPASRCVFDFCEELDKGHGRIETRRCWATDDLRCIERREAWAGLKSLVRVESLRENSGKTTTGKITREIRYYISSLPPNAKQLLSAVRSHWAIENSLHWVLDVTLREDECRIRIKNAPENMATLRRCTTNILQKVKTKNDSIKRMRKRAGWDDATLSRFLGEVAS